MQKVDTINLNKAGAKTNKRSLSGQEQGAQRVTTQQRTDTDWGCKYTHKVVRGNRKQVGSTGEANHKRRDQGKQS